MLHVTGIHELPLQEHGSFRAYDFYTFPNKPLFFFMSAVEVFQKLWGKEELLAVSNFFFSHSVFYFAEIFPPFSSNSELSSENCLILKESEIFRLGMAEGKGLTIQYPVLTTI